MERAYSLLTVKAVNEETRTIRGVATTPAVDRVGDVIDPKGVRFTNPMPLLWQHRHAEPIGTVKFSEPTEAGIDFEADIAEVREPGKLRDRIEEAWQSIKLGLVRAVSIGFAPIEYAYTETGIHFHEIEVFELSAVTIPANAEALITSKGLAEAAGLEAIRKLDTGAPAATGQVKRSPPTPAPGINPGRQAKMPTFGEQITELEARRLEATDRQAELMQATIDESRELAEPERKEFDQLQHQVEAIDSSLTRLKLLEANTAATALPVANRPGSALVPRAVPRVPATAKNTAKLEPGIRFARVVKTIVLARKQPGLAMQMAESLYADDPVVLGMIKAAVPAASTSNQGWAGALVGEESSVFADFVEFLRASTILGRFGAGGIPSLRRVPFRVGLIGQTGGFSGYWVGEGKAKPLTRGTFERQHLDPRKVAAIVVFTEELARDSSPSAEMVFRNDLAAALRERADLDFIDPANAGTPNIKPASILNTAPAVPSSGTDADAIRLDVRSLLALFLAGHNPPSSGVWVMNTLNALALGMMVNPLGQAEFPGVGVSGGTFQQLPIIPSDYVPPDIVALINASDVYFADDGGVAIDASREASLEMLDNPVADSTVPTGATNMVSLWQTDSIGLRGEWTLNWLPRRPVSAAYLTGVAWGGAVTPPS